jgi:hypothetical protein
MFYVFCDISIILAAVGLLLSVVSDIKSFKKRKSKRIGRYSNIAGIGFIASMLVTTVCFFAGF